MSVSGSEPVLTLLSQAVGPGHQWSLAQEDDAAYLVSSTLTLDAGGQRAIDLASEFLESFNLAGALRDLSLTGASVGPAHYRKDDGSKLRFLSISHSIGFEFGSTSRVVAADGTEILWRNLI